jgi:hypothetical protein
MNAPRDLGPDFRAWLRDVPPMPAELPRRTLEQTQDTRQRRRRLWFLPGRRPTAGADDEQGRMQPPAPIPKHGGLTPAQIGGTRTMFSATKLVGMAAVAALIVAVLVVGPPDIRQEVGPAAAPEATIAQREISPFSGTMQVLSQDGYGVSEPTDSGGSTTLGEQWTVEVQTDDPRFSGLGTTYDNVYVLMLLDPEDGQLSNGYVRTYKGRLFTDEGSWLTTGRAVQNPETGGLHFQELAVGEDAYAGLCAMSTFDQDEFGDTFWVEGAIFSGCLPEIPAEAPTKLPPPYDEE